MDNEKARSEKQDIRERSFEFSVCVVRLYRLLERCPDVSNVLVRQLLAAAALISANLEEARARQSKADFIHTNSISVKKARETRYWLRLIRASTDLDEPAARGIRQLENEAAELSLIIGKIVVSAKN